MVILIAGSADRIQGGMPRRSSRARVAVGVATLAMTSATCSASQGLRKVRGCSGHLDDRDVRGSLHMKRVSTPTISCRLVTLNPTFS